MPATLQWRLLSLFVLGLVLFNFPILELFALQKLVFGIPALFFYLFVIWLVYILLLRKLVDQPHHNKQDERR